MKARKLSTEERESLMITDSELLLKTKTSYLTTGTYTFDKISRNKHLFGETQRDKWYFDSKLFVLSKLGYYFSIDKDYARQFRDFTKVHGTKTNFKFYSKSQKLHLFNLIYTEH